MPHRCLNCENVISDGSEYLLDGCPDCQHNSWEFVEKRSLSEETTENESQRAARTEFVDNESLPTSAIEAIQNPNIGGGGKKNRTDKNQNSIVKSVKDIEKVQQRLNNQYDGINVVRRGKYKINLSKLYRGNDHVIKIGDDGAYTVTRASDTN